MKSKVLKVVSLCLCVAVLMCGMGIVMFAPAADGEKKTETSPVAATADANQPVTKDETVYVLANADGTVKKIIVSDWIKNTLGSATLEDKTELQNPQNVKGDEGYTTGGDKQTKVWDAKGNDIYYQGNIEKELPVSLSVSYQLDGKTLSAQDIVGKSGKVTIRYQYVNKQYEEVEIDGKKEKIYVPFAMLTGMLLDNDVFTDVTVSNGKVINDGNRTAVIGLALPGMQENLALDREKLFPDYVEITANAKNFQLGMTVTVAANGIFNNILPDDLTAVEDAKASVAKLSDAMSQLLDGSSKLYDGLNTLLEKSNQLVDGINRLATGAAALKDGATALDNGAANLRDGAISLKDGLDALDSNSASLNDGAAQVFATLLATAQTQLEKSGVALPEALSAENYAEVLEGTIASLQADVVYNQALGQVTQAVEAQLESIKQQVAAGVQAQVAAGVTEAVRQQVADGVTAAVKEQVAATVTASVRDTVAEKVIKAAAGMEKADYESGVESGAVDRQTQAQVNAAIENEMAKEETKAQIAAATDQQMNTEAVQSTIASNIEAKMATEEVQSQISANVSVKMQSDEIVATIDQTTESKIREAIAATMEGEEVQNKLAAAAQGKAAVEALKASLDSYKQFYDGLKQYTAGVSSAAQGAGELKTGADSLKAGTENLSVGIAELYDGILAVKDGVPALAQGVEQLRSGSMQLSDGLKQLNEQGVQKLADVVNGNLENLLARLRATVDVSKNYKSFAGIGDMDGQVKFIYRTDSVKKDN